MANGMKIDLAPLEWTPEDAEQLARLEAKKRSVESMQYDRVFAVAEHIHSWDMGPDDLTRAMIEQADNLVEALQPCLRVKP